MGVAVTRAKLLEFDKTMLKGAWAIQRGAGKRRDVLTALSEER